MTGSGQVMKIRDRRREISRQMGMSRNTVKEYWRTDPVRRSRNPRPSKPNPLKAYVDGPVARGVTNVTRLFYEIRQQGYAGGYTLVEHYLQPRRPGTLWRR